MRCKCGESITGYSAATTLIHENHVNVIIKCKCGISYCASLEAQDFSCLDPVAIRKAMDEEHEAGIKL